MSPSGAFLYTVEVRLSGEAGPKRALGAEEGRSQGGKLLLFIKQQRLD